MSNLKYFDEHRHATWLELFFDLVFVAAISVVTHALGHAHHGHLEVKQVIEFFLAFIPIWWIWATHTLYANRFDTDSHGHRAATLGIMFLAAMMSAIIGGHLLDSFVPFLAFYLPIRAIQAAGLEVTLIRDTTSIPHNGCRARKRRRV